MQNKKKGIKGITVVELTIALVIGLSLLAWVLNSLVTPNLSKERVVQAGNDIAAVVNGSVDWGSQRADGYSGISIEKLSADGYISKDYLNGERSNPWGGDIEITQEAGANYGFTITMTQLPEQACNRLSLKFLDSNCNLGTFSYTITAM